MSSDGSSGGGGLYEMLFDRVEGHEEQQVGFLVDKGLERYETKDLWAPHPGWGFSGSVFRPGWGDGDVRKHGDKTGLWIYKGRTDDLVVFSHGENLWTREMEDLDQGG